MTQPIPADTEAVSQAWLPTLPGITADMVGATLPKDNTTWTASGFITTYAIGGTPQLYVPLRQPKLMVCCWWATPGTAFPPWNKAKYLAELIVEATYDTTNFGNLLNLPNADHDAVVLTAYPLSEPRRSFGDIGDYACFTFDLQINWTAR